MFVFCAFVEYFDAFYLTSEVETEPIYYAIRLTYTVPLYVTDGHMWYIQM